MIPLIQTLERLASELERKARAVRDVIKVLDEHNGERRAGSTRRGTRDRRRQTAAFLATFDPVKPRKPESPGARAGVGALVRHGFLKPKNSGFVRTSKPFLVGDEVTPAPK